MIHLARLVSWSVVASLCLAAAVVAAEPPEGPSMPPIPIKAMQSPAERKLDTPLQLQLRGLAPDGSERAADGPVTVELAGTISAELADAVTAAHGTVIEQSPRWGLMRATLPLAAVLEIAARPDVRSVRLPARARTN